MIQNNCISDWPMAALIGQQHHLYGKWPTADHYIVLSSITCDNLIWKYTKVNVANY